MRTTYTYGVLPPRADFDEAYERELGGGKYRIRNDKLVGDCDLSRSELWQLIQDCAKRWRRGGRKGDMAGDLAHSILTTLGIEWV